MDRKALFDAVRPYAPGAKLKPEWVPMIDALADALGLPREGGGLGEPDPELIAALKTDEGLRLAAYPDPMSPRAAQVGRLCRFYRAMKGLDCPPPGTSRLGGQVNYRFRPVADLEHHSLSKRRNISIVPAMTPQAAAAP